MFFAFTVRLVHDTNRLSIIWEVEVALASVLIETIESEEETSLTNLIVEAADLLAGRVTSAELLEQSRKDLQFVSQRNKELFGHLMARVADPAARPALRRELNPVMESILTACRDDNAFAEYIKKVGVIKSG